jgi:hypothetical protein
MEEEMKELYAEGVATHGGPGLCVGDPQGRSEALVGARVGRAIELHLGDAKQFLHDLRERFATFSLELHPDKTRLIEFGRFAAGNRAERGLGKPETFDFLGHADLGVMPTWS